MLCPQCRTVNVPEAHFCISCGSALSQGLPTQPRRSILDEAADRDRDREYVLRWSGEDGKLLAPRTAFPYGRAR
jgi:hypothetical protein